MFDFSSVAINLRQHLAQVPATLLKTKLRSRHVLMVENTLDLTIRLMTVDPIVRTIIRDLKAFFRDGVVAGYSRARVMRGKSVAVLLIPLPDGPFVGHAVRATDRPQRLAPRQPLANLSGQRLRELR